MEQLDRGLRRGAGDGLVNAVAARHRAHGHDAVGQRLGHGDHVGHDAEGIGGELLAGPPEAADHLVEDQQDAVAVADLAQALQVALGRHQHADRAGDRLDDAGGDGIGPVQIDEALQVVGEFRAGLRLAAHEPMLGQAGMAQVQRARQPGAEHALVVDQAGHREAAEVDAMIGELAPDQAAALPLALGHMVGKSDF